MSIAQSESFQHKRHNLMAQLFGDDREEIHHKMYEKHIIHLINGHNSRSQNNVRLEMYVRTKRKIGTETDTSTIQSLMRGSKPMNLM